MTIPRIVKKKEGPPFRFRCYLYPNRILKRLLYRSAFSCISHHEQSGAYYRKKRAEGKGHHQAVIAPARRRVDVLWAMLRDGEVYDERPPRVA